MNKSKSGFTLIELLVVIVVIGILASVSAMAYSGVRNRAVESVIARDLSGMTKNLKLFYVDYGAYSDNAFCNNIAATSTSINPYPLTATSRSSYTSLYLFAYRESSYGGHPGLLDPLVNIAIVARTSTGKVLASTTANTTVKDITTEFAANTNDYTATLLQVYDAKTGAVCWLDPYIRFSAS